MTDLPHPWNEFLAELDKRLNEPVDLHCIGGFVCTYYYGLARRIGDIRLLHNRAEQAQPCRDRRRRVPPGQEVRNFPALRPIHKSARQL